MLLCNMFFIRSKEIDWQPYFTTRIVDDFGTHLRVFRKAQQKVTEKDDQVTGNIFIPENYDFKICFVYIIQYSLNCSFFLQVQQKIL